MRVIISMSIFYLTTSVVTICEKAKLNFFLCPFYLNGQIETLAVDREKRTGTVELANMINNHIVHLGDIAISIKAYEHISKNCSFIFLQPVTDNGVYNVFSNRNNSCCSDANCI